MNAESEAMRLLDDLLLELDNSARGANMRSLSDRLAHAWEAHRAEHIDLVWRTSPYRQHNTQEGHHMTTELQEAVAKKLEAQQAADKAAAADLQQRIDAAKAKLTAERQEREAKLEAERLAQLQAAQQRRDADYEQQLRKRARSGFQGSDAAFEAVYPQLRDTLIRADLLAADRNRPVMRL